MNLQTIRAMIRQEAASRLIVGTVISVDARGTNMVSVRASGGRVHTRTYTCTSDLEIGDKVLMARLAALDRVVIIGKLTGVEGTLRKRAILAPPDDLAVVGYAGILVAAWSNYPGIDVCYQIQHNTTGSADGNEVTAILTRGSYYLYPIVDDDTDSGDPTTHYFRVRAVRWLGDNNVMYSGWSAWASDASVTWDGRYRTETELASTNVNEGASLIGIFDSAGNFSSTDVEGALEEAYDAAGGVPIGASYVVIALDGDLTNERVATAGTAISLTDGGAGGNLTFAVVPSDIDHDTLSNITSNAHHNPITLDVNADALLSLSTQELGLDTQAANLVFAGPISGVDAVPTFRSLIATDLPTAVQSMITAGLDALTQAEVDQLENIAATTISAAQWGYLGAMDQSVATATSPTFVGLIIPDATADAFEIIDGTTGDEYLGFRTAAQKAVIINEDGADIDFIIEASGVADALIVQGSDGQITLGALGAGFVRSSIGGVLSVAAEVSLVQLGNYAQKAMIRGGAGDWEAFSAATAGYAIVSTGIAPAFDLTPDWQGVHTFSAGLAVDTAQIITMGDGAMIGAGAADLRIIFWSDPGLGYIEIGGSGVNVYIIDMAPDAETPMTPTAANLNIIGGNNAAGDDAGLWLRNEETNVDWSIFVDESDSDYLKIAREDTVVLEIGTTGDVVISHNLVVGAAAALAKIHADQAVNDAAIPVLYLDQADISEEMIEFATAIGVGNAIEAVGGKTLTVTHFIKCTLPGALTRYIPVGTIA